jgi:hypothetical protein
MGASRLLAVAFDRSLRMLLAAQRREPLVELAPGQEPVVARDQRAGCVASVGT